MPIDIGTIAASEPTSVRIRWGLRSLEIQRLGEADWFWHLQRERAGEWSQMVGHTIDHGRAGTLEEALVLGMGMGMAPREVTR